jgi:hypothetical protein
MRQSPTFRATEARVQTGCVGTLPPPRALEEQRTLADPDSLGAGSKGGGEETDLENVIIQAVLMEVD